MTYHDNRYQPPRDRSPPPGRFNDRRPFGSRPSSPGARDHRDAPRGPRHADGSARSGPGAFPGPRRGGLQSRVEGRDQRDGPPSNDLSRRPSWRGDRDMDFDRRNRDRRSPPRERSPLRRRADSRDRPAADLDIRRARRHSGDGPPSASSTVSDSARFGATQYRGGPARLRGRGSYDPRERGRPSYGDERDRDQPIARSRSRGSRTERDNDRWDGRRDDPRRPVPKDDRDLDRPRREFPPSRADSRISNPAHESRVVSGPSDSADNAPPVPHLYRLNMEADLDTDHGPERSRRAMSFQMSSTTFDDVRRDLEGGEGSLNRSDAGRERKVMRVPSPSLSSGPQVPPQVPAFGGSFMATRSAPGASSTSTTQQKPEPLAAEKRELLDVVSAPVAVAERSMSQTTTQIADDRSAIELEKAASSDHTSRSPTTTTTKDNAVAKSPVLPQPSPVSRYPQLFGPAANVPTAPRAPSSAELLEQAHIAKRRKTSTPPRGSAIDRVPPGTFQHSPPQKIKNLPPTVPLGPRAGSGALGSPPAPGTKIPTGPRADREPWLPPAAPRASNVASTSSYREPPRGPAARNPQWTRPVQQPYSRAPTLPAKRDAAGLERQPGIIVRKDSPITDRASNSEATQALLRPDPAVRHGVTDNDAPNRPEVDTNLARTNRPAGTVDSDTSLVATMTQEPSSAGLIATTSDTSDDDEETMSDMLKDIHAKHDRLYANVLAKKQDLGAPEYQSIPLLLKLSLLNAIVASDIRDFLPAMDLPHHFAGKVTSSESMTRPLTSPRRLSIPKERAPNILLTPKAEDEDVIMEDVEDTPLRPRRPARKTIRRTSTPELTSLPYLTREPMSPVSDAEQLRKQIDSGTVEKFARYLESQSHADTDLQSDLLEEYRRRYLIWRSKAEAMEKIEQEEAEARERLARENAIGETPEPDAAGSAVPPSIASAVPLPTPTEGRRSHRFASQLDLDLAIQASLESAKEDQAKQERETAIIKPDLAKEAVIPDMLTPTQVLVRTFYDSNQARKPEYAIEFFDFVPPVDDFTAEEHELLVASYKADPKAWGKIAQSLPGRSYKECINHYYQTKWTTDYKSLKDRRRKGIRSKRKALGGARSALTGLGDRDGEDQTSALTETGRPRRLAAPTFGEKETDADLANTATKKPSMTEQPLDGKAKKTRLPKGEGRRKKAQQQISSAKLSGHSPTKVDRQNLAVSGSVERDNPGLPETLESSTMLPTYAAEEPARAPFSVGERIQRPNISHDRSALDIAPSIELEGVSKEKSRGHNQTQRAGASSYWSVQEQTDFKHLISIYGTDFQTISQIMGTKTHIMVKNFYTKKSDMPELVKSAEVANARRKEGLSNVEPPLQSLQQRRHLESTQLTGQRPLAPVPGGVQPNAGASIGVKDSSHTANHPSLDARGSRHSPAADSTLRYRHPNVNTSRSTALGTSPPGGAAAPPLSYIPRAEPQAEARFRDEMPEAIYSADRSQMRARQDDMLHSQSNEQFRQSEQVQHELRMRDQQHRYVEQHRQVRDNVQSDGGKSRQFDYNQTGSDRNAVNLSHGYEPEFSTERTPWAVPGSVGAPRNSLLMDDVRARRNNRVDSQTNSRVHPSVHPAASDTNIDNMEQPAHQNARHQAPPMQTRAEPRRSNLMDLLNTTSELQDTAIPNQRSVLGPPTTVPSPGVPGMASTATMAERRIAPVESSGQDQHVQSFHRSYRSIQTNQSSAGSSNGSTLPPSQREEGYEPREHRDSWPGTSDPRPRYSDQGGLNTRHSATTPFRTNSPASVQHMHPLSGSRDDFRSPTAFSSAVGHRSALANLGGATRPGPSPPPPLHAAHSRTNSYTQPFSTPARHQQQAQSMGQTSAVSRVQTPPAGYAFPHDTGGRDVGMRLQPNPYADTLPQPSERRSLPSQSQGTTHIYPYSQAAGSRPVQQSRPVGVAGVNSMLRDPAEAAHTRRLEVDRARELQRQEDVRMAREHESVGSRDRESQREREQKDRDLERQRDYQRQQWEQSRRAREHPPPHDFGSSGYSADSRRVQTESHRLGEHDPHAYRSGMHEPTGLTNGVPQIPREGSQVGRGMDHASQQRYGHPPGPSYPEHEHDGRTGGHAVQTRQGFEHAGQRAAPREHDQSQRHNEGGDGAYHHQRYEYESRPRQAPDQQRYQQR